MDKLAEWKAARQACRTDLYYLCKVLGYKDVTRRVHGRLVDNLQKFQGGVDEIEPKELPNLKENQIALPGGKHIRESYRAHIPDFWNLTGPRQRLNMIPRGHLKTTVATVAHSIQWIINYPNIRILIFTHSDGKAKDFLGMIKNHFTQNVNFRYLFPEHVPFGKAVNDFGNQEKFNTLARSNWIDKESTLQFLTIDSAKAGGHYDVVKCDDVVDETNIITEDRIEAVKRAFAALEPLVDKRDSADGGQRGWMDLTGTFYHYSDLNYDTYETERARLDEKEWADLNAITDPAQRDAAEAKLIEQERKIEPRTWECNVQSAAPNWPDPAGPYLWPERYGYKILKAIENDPRAGAAHLAAQYLLNPVPFGTGLLDDENKIVFTPRKYLNEIYARLSLYVAVDLAGMDETAKNFNKNDFTCITLGGFGTDGHLYILESIHGRPKPQEVIEHLFAIYKRHPRIIQIKIEKEAHARVLLPFLKPEMDRRGYLPILAIPRDNQQSKTHKLKGLQPWFELGRVHIADDLVCKAHAKKEIMRFPKFKDDWLDTVHDLMATAEGGITHEVTGRQQEEARGNASIPKGLEFLFQDEPASQVDSMTGW